MKKKIYTRRGDGGQTTLIGGQRVYKYDVRVEAYGTIDELNSNLGLLATYLENEELEQIRYIQTRLFDVGTSLAKDIKVASEIVLMDSSMLNILEKWIDQIETDLPDRDGFIIPGGVRASALCQVCRTVCRRAERRIVELASQKPVDPVLIKVMNRLSDFLFVFGLKLNIRNV